MFAARSLRLLFQSIGQAQFKTDRLIHTTSCISLVALPLSVSERPIVGAWRHYEEQIERRCFTGMTCRSFPNEVVRRYGYGNVGRIGFPNPSIVPRCAARKVSRPKMERMTTSRV